MTSQTVNRRLTVFYFYHKEKDSYWKLKTPQSSCLIFPELDTITQSLVFPLSLSVTVWSRLLPLSFSCPAPPFLRYTLLWLTSSRDRKGQRRTDFFFPTEKIACHGQLFAVLLAVCASVGGVYALTFFSRSGSLKVSRNFLTCSDRSRSMLRASIARPRNSSTSSSGFKFSCGFLNMKCLKKRRWE